jgi:uncharacterized protein (TIGR02453 family)
MDLPKLNRFLTELENNNNKTWFDANRPTYLELKADFEDLVGCILQEVAKFDESVAMIKPKDCIFRINRDVRFGKNKTPYKTHLSAVIGEGKKGDKPTFYIQVDGKTLMLGGGLPLFGSPNANQILKSIRTTILNDPEQFIKIITNKDLVANFDLDLQWSLKNLPKGYENRLEELQTKNAELYQQICNYLKLKNFLFDKTTDSPKQDIPNRELATTIAEKLSTLYPLNSYLKKAMWLTVE